MHSNMAFPISVSYQNLKEILGDLPDDVFDRIIDESDLTRDQKVRLSELIGCMSLLSCLSQSIAADLETRIHGVVR